MPLSPAKMQKTPACIRETQVHKLGTKVYSQNGLTATHFHHTRWPFSWQLIDQKKCKKFLFFFFPLLFKFCFWSPLGVECQNCWPFFRNALFNKKQKLCFDDQSFTCSHKTTPLTGGAMVQVWLAQQSGTVVVYHWRELPQVSFLSRQKFCHNTSKLLSRQTYFVMTKRI